MKASKIRWSVVLVAGALLAGCNNSNVVGMPADPSPTPGPTPSPEAPVAIIESGSPIYSTLDTGTFDGSYSFDMDGYITTYAWQLIGKPVASTAVLTPGSYDGSTSTLFIDLAGDYSVQLTVTDDSGLTGTTTYDFSATPSALHVQLNWPNQYTQADMDLHMIDLTAPVTPAPDLWDWNYDCHYRNCKPFFGQSLDWGSATSNVDNPRLDIDNITESVPENMNIEMPVDGTYRVEVHYYASHTASGDIPVDATVNIYIANTLVYTSSATMSATDETWTVGEVMWSSSSGTVVPIMGHGTTVKPNFFAGSK